MDLMNDFQQEERCSTNKQQRAAVQPLLYTKRDAATLLSLSLRTVDNLIARKELRTVRIGRRVLIPVAELNQFIKRDHPILRAA